MKEEEGKEKNGSIDDENIQPFQFLDSR